MFKVGIISFGTSIERMLEINNVIVVNVYVKIINYSYFSNTVCMGDRLKKI